MKVKHIKYVLLVIASYCAHVSEDIAPRAKGKKDGMELYQMCIITMDACTKRERGIDDINTKNRHTTTRIHQYA